MVRCSPLSDSLSAAGHSLTGLSALAASAVADRVGSALPVELPAAAVPLPAPALLPAAALPPVAWSASFFPLPQPSAAASTSTNAIDVRMAANLLPAPRGCH